MGNWIVQMVCVTCLTAGHAQSELKLWYDSPAAEWT